jgi:hypothetical protein
MGLIGVGQLAGEHNLVLAFIEWILHICSSVAQVNNVVPMCFLP